MIRAGGGGDTSTVAAECRMRGVADPWWPEAAAGPLHTIHNTDTTMLHSHAVALSSLSLSLTDCGVGCCGSSDRDFGRKVLVVTVKKEVKDLSRCDVMNAKSSLPYNL